MRDGEWAIRAIEQHRNRLSRQQFKTLIGQAKAGNPDAAMRGLDKILGRGQENGRA